MLDGRVEDVRHEDEGLVNGLVAERDAPLTPLVPDGPPGIARIRSRSMTFSLRYPSTRAIVISHTWKAWKNGRRCFRNRHWLHRSCTSPRLSPARVQDRTGQIARRH